MQAELCSYEERDYTQCKRLHLWNLKRQICLTECQKCETALRQLVLNSDLRCTVRLFWRVLNQAQSRKRALDKCNATMRQEEQIHSHNAERLEQLQQDVVVPNKARLLAELRICDLLKPYVDDKQSKVSAVSCFLHILGALTPCDIRRRWTQSFSSVFGIVSNSTTNSWLT